MTKNGIRARQPGAQMHGAGLKKKYRAHAPDAKGKATRGKK